MKASSCWKASAPCPPKGPSSTTSGHPVGGDGRAGSSSSHGGVAKATSAAAPSREGVPRGPPGVAPCGQPSPIQWGSLGLGGLAAGLASRGEPRPALHAAVTALQAAGVSEPTDLALAGRRGLRHKAPSQSCWVDALCLERTRRWWRCSRPPGEALTGPLN